MLSNCLVTSQPPRWRHVRSVKVVLLGLLRAILIWQSMPRAVLPQPVEPEAYINFARIDAPEDVQNVMQQMADAFMGDVDAARRGEK